MTRQLERAACAGVQAVILTGCDLEGSRKGAEVCESWLQQQRQQQAPQGGGSEPVAPAITSGRGQPTESVELWTTSGCHPHDSSKVRVSTE